MWQPIPDRDQLVHLLLVLGDREARLCVIQHELDLVGDGILIYGYRHGTERLSRQHRPIELWPVVTDDGDLVATTHAKGGKAAGNGPDGSGRVLPAIGLPDA